MKFALTEEQTMLRDTLSRFLRDNYSFEQRGKYMAHEQGFDPATWQSYAELGLTALAVPQAHDGFGASMSDISLVMHEMGRALCIEPYLGTCIVVSALLESATAPEAAKVLSEIASGEKIASFAHLELAGWKGEAEALQMQAKAVGDGYALRGEKTAVLHGAQADVLLVSARLESGEIALGLVNGDAPGLARHDVATHDGMRAASLVFDAAPGHVVLKGVDAEQAIARAEAVALAAMCAESVGCMEMVLELTIEYLNTREQFGRPIGSFQALQHAAAQMLVDLEQARSMAQYATAMCCEEDAGVRDAALSAAKVQICQSSRAIGQAAIQLHGGVGMTMEFSIGHYFKRMTIIETALGGLDFHLDRLSRLGGVPA